MHKRLLIAVTLGGIFFAQTIHSVSTSQVEVINNTPFDLTIASRAQTYGPALAPEAVEIVGTADLAPLKDTEIPVLRFERFAKGIKNNATYQFTTAINLPTVGTIYLRQKIVGDLTGSKLFYSIEGPGTQLNWYTDRKEHEAIFQKSGHYYTVTFRSVFTGFFDNIRYTIDYRYAPDTASLLKELSKNVVTLLERMKSSEKISDKERDVIYGLILRGALFNNALRSDDEQLLAYFGQDPVAAMRALNWFYFALAVNKKEGFEGGTYITNNPRLYDFLMQHGAYLRKSSHFGAYAKFTNQPDVLKTHAGFDLDALPRNKFTNLFGKVNQTGDLIFIKPEEAGTKGFMAFAEHAKNYLFSQARKKLPTLFEQMRRFKDTPTALETYILDYIGSDDDPENRKERIPAQVLKDYYAALELLRGANVFDEKTEEYLTDEAAAWGIQKMYENAKRYRDILSTITPRDNAHRKQIEKARTQLSKLIASLETNYDNLNQRFGREVILTEKDFNVLNPADLAAIRSFYQL